jgi:hypothetical protein
MAGVTQLPEEKWIMIPKTGQKKNKAKAMRLIAFTVLIAISSLSCKDSRPPVFTGYTPLRMEQALNFEALAVHPERLLKKYLNEPDTILYWERYRLNREYDIIQVCSSVGAIATGRSYDTLIINNIATPLSLFFRDYMPVFRVFEIQSFKFKDTDYLLLIGDDVSGSTMHDYSDIILLARLDSGSVKLLCPPLILDYGSSNTQAFLPYYLNDFNKDENLDFLQWNGSDSIVMYSIIDDIFVKQKEFIKTTRKSEYENVILIDERNSNWPYALFKQDSMRQNRFDLNGSRYELDNSYY